MKCREHREEKIYVRLEGEPATRSEITFQYFTVDCQSGGRRDSYSVRDILAEQGAVLPLTGTAIGAMLFIFAPLAGAIGALAGFITGTDKERRRVEEFNRS